MIVQFSLLNNRLISVDGPRENRRAAPFLVRILSESVKEGAARGSSGHGSPGNDSEIEVIQIALLVNRL